MRSSLPITVGAAMLVLACSEQTDARNRRAFEAAQRQNDLGTANDGELDPRGDGNGGGAPSGEVEGWDRVLATMSRASRILARSPDPRRFEALAQRWCAFEPEPLATEYGVVRVCVPTPRFVVDGHELTFELAELGTISLVATELPEDESATMTTRASSRLVELCMEAFRMVEPPPGRAASREAFQVCPIEGGATLAIGRLPTPGTSTWQVSIAMVSAN